MYRQDFILKEIHKAIRFLVLLILNKKEIEVDEILYRESPKYLMLLARIKDYIKDGEISSAQDLIFENNYKNDPTHFEIGLWFYDEINKFDDEKLKSMNFSRVKIKTGLSDLLKLYGYDEYIKYLNF